MTGTDKMMHGKPRRSCVWIGVWLAILAPAAWAQDTVRPAKVFTVEQSASEIRRSYPAIVLPSREVELSFQVSGRVTELPVRAATQVSEGDVIAQLDPRDFRNKIAQLQSQIEQAEAELLALRTGARPEEIAALEASVAAAEAQLNQASDNVERIRQLSERGVAPAAQLEGAEADFSVAEANLRSQREQLRIGQAGGRPEEIAAAEAAIRGLDAQLQVAEDDLADATLRAPFDGIIARRDIENFTNVQSGQTVALLQALDTVHLAFDIPGPDVSTFSRTGFNNVTNIATFDSLPGETFPAEIVEFSVQADAATQTYRGRASVRVPDGTIILPGMVASVLASSPNETRTMPVPLSAVGGDPAGAAFVWRVGADDTISRQPVSLGEARQDRVDVLDGLEDGDVIVSAGVSRLTDGMKIRPIASVGN
ncbi:efflux RND transporter periplasmic adaptor subunit [Sulfitobacter sp. D35]|uniref:efflux RND transporter periplasmic adaptor subunit n=1 Tax=Sulfitobacter sp. D35 TaxID=3083252 RepID=UPI00296FD04F|nr:efflux RND transporter periplasmic adaptor subunit [Sulfitobacter sp. D35]MDW4497185.1 efflux RND transporter periplasmic adaptor subunit [Sulfitobacter sp. D35]